MAEGDLQVPAYDRTAKIVSLYGEAPADGDICYPAYDRSAKLVALRLAEASEDDLVISLYDRQAAITAAFTGGAEGFATNLYVYGGGIAGATSDCDGYTPDSWTSKTNLPAPARWEHAASTIGSSGYIYGGQDSAVNKDCDEYTPDSWANKADLPVFSRRGPAGTTIFSAAYMLGGFYDLRTRQMCQQYIPNAWADKTSFPIPPRMQFAASTIGVAAYIYSGVWFHPASGDHLIVGDCDQYIPDTWTAKTSISSPDRFLHAATTVGSSGYVFGGSDAVSNPPVDDGWATATGPLQDCDQYTPDTWAAKTGLPSPARYGLSASTLGDSAYICGGHNSGELKDCDEYTPDSWANKSDMPSPVRESLAQSSI